MCNLVHTVLIGIASYSSPVNRGSSILDSMADFLAVLGIVGFIVAMLGLIWALDRV
jgi:hypothetical protein